MSFHWESTVWAIVSFAALYLLLNRYAFGPLFSIMEKRRELVKEELNNAQANREQSEKLIEEQKKALEETRKEAYEILERARATSTRQGEEYITAAKAEASRIKEEALRDIESEKNKAVAALRGQVGAMSVMIASKIIEKQVDEKTQQDLVNQYLKEVGDKS